MELPIGEKIINGLWIRLPIRDLESVYEDNYYYAPTECFCNKSEGYASTGINEPDSYTFSDEFGDCDFCKNVFRQINGHNDDIPFNELAITEIENYLIDLQSGKLGVPTLEQLQNAGNLHILLERGNKNE